MKRLFYALGLMLGFQTFANAATDCNQVTEIPVSECQSLLDLYNSTDGANWTNKTGWNQTNTPCSWFGVSCANGSVQWLSLAENNLKGQLPNLNFPNLTAIWVNNNQITGIFPTFNTVPNLEQLSISSNSLTGTIPDLNNLPKLRQLHTSGNQLGGTIPNFSYLLNLEELELGGNQLVGNIPDFNNLPKLQLLGLSNNKLGGNIPDFSNLPNLLSLSLDRNQLTGNIPNFSKLPNLLVLSLFMNPLTGTIPNFNNLPNLRDLSLTATQLTGAIPDFNLPKLENLQLSSIPLTGTIPNFSFFNLANLQILTLGYNCDLVAYDATQEAILNQKIPDWKTNKHPACSAGGICTDTNGSTQSGIDLVIGTPSSYGLMLQTSCQYNQLVSQAQLDTAKQSGIDLVKATPANYGLFTQAQLDAAKQNATQSCPSYSCPICSCPTNTQAQLDAAKQSGIDLVKTTPANYGLFTQTQLDIAKQNGVDLVKATPANYGLFTQAQVDAIKQTSIALVTTAPSNYGLFNQAQIDSAKQTGVQEGINQCKNDPNCKGTGISQAQLDEAVNAAKQSCKANPASCGLFSQIELDSAKELAKQEGINQCKNDPNCKSIHATYNPLNGEVHIPFVNVGTLDMVQTFDVYLIQRNDSFTFDLDLSRVSLVH